MTLTSAGTGAPDALPLIMIGSGGHARVLLDLLNRLGRRVLFATDSNICRHGKRLGELEIRGDDSLILDFAPDEILLVNGVGSVGTPQSRRAVYERFGNLGYRFDTLVHPTATVGRDVTLQAGVQVMAGAVIQTGAIIGEDAIINTNASVDHDCRIGAHTHVAPGVTLSGEVCVGDTSHIGTSAAVIQGVRIGREVVVGAGAVVVREVGDGLKVVGVPARVAEPRRPLHGTCGAPEFTVMLSAAGRRVALLRHLRESVEEMGLCSRVLATDITRRSAAMHLSGGGVLVPRYTSPDCLQTLVHLCREEQVRLIVPTIDPDLPFYATHQAAFEAAGTRIAVSSAQAVEIGNDKALTHRWLVDNGLPTVRQIDAAALLKDGSGWKYPLFAKPRTGSSSIGAQAVQSADELRVLVRDTEYIVQELAPGVEYTVDVYVDRSGKCRCAVPRLRIETRGGEVVKGMTVRHPAIIDLARRVAEALPGAWGVMNIQIFHDDATGRSAVIEINPRFGGGYPLAHHAGAHMTRWTIEEALGRPCTAHDQWQDGLVMLRYDEAIFVARQAVGITTEPASAVQNTGR